VHISGRENVNQQTDERDKARVNSAQSIHSQTEIGAEISDLNPRPELVEHRLFSVKRAAVGEKRDVKRDDARNQNRAARDRPAKEFILQPTADYPVYDGTGERRENY